MNYNISIAAFKRKNIYSLSKEFQGESPKGDQIGFTNYYMEMNKKPFFGISGEFHFSRYDDRCWEDEIIKMKMCGINVISTYVFWIHHEEEEGVFDFSGCRNLRKFIELCGKHNVFAIIRIGPFNHGEARNGGIPDWLYGKPFEVRKLSEGFMFYTKRLYSKIFEQIEGLLYKDGGPIIAAQIDNEYMHSSAPWEITTGISNEWVFGGDEGEAYMLTLRDMAKECGIITPFYTCTGWGGAITPSSMMPLWGGYAYRPWLFYAECREHPSTEEYVYQDFHNNNAVVTSDFKPSYEPESRPYACCEMGGGMTCTYNYRFALPFKSVDAMSNIKLASGCNFLGYYVFHGGTNPKGKHGLYMNESQAPKLSYDYQAALGEFGQIRESFCRLKAIHYFCQAFGEALCRMGTILPQGASWIDAKDLDTLRFALRTDGERGFLFLNNFQDHENPKPKKDESVTIQGKGEVIKFEGISLEAGENCILPFHMDLDGIELVKATAQPVTRIKNKEDITYVFLKPEGMNAAFTFEEGAVTVQHSNIWTCSPGKECEIFHIFKGDRKIRILCINREKANQMYILKNQTLLFAKGGIMEDEGGIRFETTQACNTIFTYPKDAFCLGTYGKRAGIRDEIFDVWTINAEEKKLKARAAQTAAGRYTVAMPENFMDGLKDVLLRISYEGDIGQAFIDGDMIHDNFCNGEIWEIGLRTFKERLSKNPLTIFITPRKEGRNVNVESAMAARMETASAFIGALKEATLCPVYEFKIN